MTNNVFRTVMPRKSTGEWMCGRVMAWHRDLGLELGEIIVKSDTELSLTGVVESCSMFASDEGRIAADCRDSKSNGIDRFR